MDQPNILMIMSDQHSSRALGCHGGVARTPSLDRLAADGVDFRAAHCAAPLCVPSRMAFLTGRHPSDIGVWTNRCLLDSNVPTFAHALTGAGYETMLCGRMHFGGSDQHHGFGRRLVGDVSGARYDHEPLFEGRVPEYSNGQDARSVAAAGIGTTSYLAYDRDVTRRTCEFLATEADRPRERPFLLLAGYLSPHNPYVCPRHLFEEYLDRHDEILDAEPDPATLHPAIRQWRDARGATSITREQARYARAAYHGLVTHLDEQVGAVLDALAGSGAADNTVVVYLADHGEMAGEHGMWWKDSFYEASVSVPMIWSGPGVASGARIDTPVSLLDVAPTLAAISGAQHLPGSRGRSLVDAIGGTAALADSTAVYSEMMPVGLWPARMVRLDDYKLCHYHGFDRPQLFNLASDPDEVDDLGSDDRYGELAAGLMDLVTADWSGDRIAVEAGIREQGADLTEAVRLAHPPGEAERWHVPVGSNQYVNATDRPRSPRP